MAISNPPAHSNSHTQPSFENISHLSELLIVIFYAEAYREAVTHGLECFQKRGLIGWPVLLFFIFFFVTVRFFVGNYFHLANGQWETVWEQRRARNLYYFDALFIILESLAMILLGGLASVEASAKLLVWLLIIPSGIDVFWIGLQELLNLDAKRKACRPSTKLNKWLKLNIWVILLLGGVLYCAWSDPLSTTVLWVIFGITFAAFVWDVFKINAFGA